MDAENGERRCPSAVSLDPADIAERGHQNLIEFCRQSACWGEGGEVRESLDVVMYASGSSALASYNGAFRLHPGVSAEALLDEADEYFLPAGRVYSIKVRDTGEDDDLEAACRRRRMVSFSEPSPHMALCKRLPAAPLPPGLELRSVTTESDVVDFRRVSAESYRAEYPPEEIEALFSYPAGLLAASGVITLVGYLDTRPVAAAQALVSHDIGGVYWVGAVDDVRGRGIGEAVSRAVTNASFNRSARACVLQTSRMGETIYRRLGYVILCRYRTYLAVRRPKKTVSAG
jgi:hypothetical protein